MQPCSVHDGDIAPMITALDLFPDAEHLPTTHIAHDRRWRKSQVSPMGGRIIFERMVCAAAGDDGQEDAFVRINVNDGIVPLPGCDNGPGRSCPLDAFRERIAHKGSEVGKFGDRCGLKKSAKERITFLKQ